MEDNKENREFKPPSVEPWPDPVNGKLLLEAIVRLLRRFVVLPKWAYETLALWVVHTYAFHMRNISTYRYVQHYVASSRNSVQPFFVLELKRKKVFPQTMESGERRCSVSKARNGIMHGRQRPRIRSSVETNREPRSSERVRIHREGAETSFPHHKEFHKKVHFGC